MERCGGGFFHSPPALEVGAPPGAPLYARLTRGEVVAAVAAGTVCRCRLGAHHYYFPTSPAVAPEEDPHAAAAALLDALSGRRAATVGIDSFDAPGRTDFPPGAVSGRARTEHVVSLAGGEEDLARCCGRTHRRHLARGERNGWTLHILEAAAAVDALRAVQDSAAERAAHRGDPFTGRAPVRTFGGPAGDLRAPWGTATFAALAGEELLAAALVGWGNRRAFYLIGGSTPEGYRQSAAVWLHWRIMATLTGHGHTVYNLGGTPAAAAAPDHPGHGLFRFKTGFGGEQVECRGARWEIRSLHQRAHRLVARITELLEGIA